MLTRQGAALSNSRSSCLLSTNPRWLRREAIPFRLITNTTTVSRTRLAVVLREAGFVVESEEILSAAGATGAYLRAHHPGARCFVLGETVDLAEDLEGVDLVGEGADVVVVAGADDDFTWANMNRALGMRRTR